MTSPVPASGRDAALLEKFDTADRPTVARGRRSDVVGTTPERLTFQTFTGEILTFEEEIVVVGFLDGRCATCRIEAQKMATLAVVYYGDLDVVALASDGAGDEVQSTVTQAGGDGLILAGEDGGNRIAEGLGVERRPSLAVIGPTGTVDAVWAEQVPLKVLYSFLRAAYDLDR